MISPPVRARAATAQLLKLPLRFGAEGSTATGPEVIERGWIGGLQEAKVVLEYLLGTDPCSGTAFSLVWPYVAGDGWLVAPAIPVVAAAETQDAVDGTYRLTTAGVRRESMCGELLLLSTGAATAAPSPRPFDLLWFSPTARCLLRGGVIEAEDPFCRVRVPVGRDRLEALLVRSQRFDESVIEGFQLDAARRPATLEVRRDLALAGDQWCDPWRVLGHREGVQKVDRRGEDLLLRLAGGGEVVANASVGAAGWVAELGPGLPWTRAEMVVEERTLVYRVTLIPTLDPLDPGVRTRLAFDLLSDLLVLERRG